MRVDSNVSHVLIVDDDASVRNALAAGLEEAGFKVSQAAGKAALFEHLEGLPRVDVITLDLMLGNEDGFEIARQIRAKRNIPIIMVTALNDPIDRVLGLERGADDYITKPFHIREVVLRIRSVLRRYALEHASEDNAGEANQSPGPASNGTQERYRFAAGTVDVARREFSASNENPLALTDAEFDLLVAFLRNPSRVMTRDDLSMLVRGRLWSPTDRTLDGHIARLRKKIEPDIERPQLIKTVWGVGYVFAGDVEQLGKQPSSAARKVWAS